MDIVLFLAGSSDGSHCCVAEILIFTVISPMSLLRIRVTLSQGHDVMEGI